MRLSCLECRRRKLMCDRAFPCDRCIKSGTQDKCSYETKSVNVTNASSGVPSAFVQLDPRRAFRESSDRDDASILQDAARDHDRIRQLEMELNKMKDLLTQQSKMLTSGTVANSPSSRKDAEVSSVETREQRLSKQPYLAAPDHWGELRFFKGKEFRTRYFGPNNASRAFAEVYTRAYRPKAFGALC